VGSPERPLELASPSTPRPAPAPLRGAARVAMGRSRLLHVLEVAREPLVLVLSLWAVTLALEGTVGAPEVLLALVVFSLTFPSGVRLSQPPAQAVRDTLVSWAMVSGLLFLLGYATRYADYFYRDTLITWWWVAAVCLVASHFALLAAAPAIRRLDGAPRRALLAGMNGPGLELARRLRGEVYTDVELVGFADDRARERLAPAQAPPLLGSIEELPELVKRHRIDLVYLALPMASQPRIRALLEALHDTTASVYFVPDMFVTELIQGRVDSVSGMPVVAVCDSPFHGVDGLVKRASDIVLSLLILVPLAPVIALLAAAVKVTSPGPAIFRQRRYGMDGEEIVVYKLRTMRVTEDGEEIRQCAHGDPRVTPLGALMRRSSLDELPQFVNVLQGRMSIVGPRPHAVAHNELYRKLIKGYMLRHKVKPGITGWAQVNGCRGETDTLDKMRARVAYDLDYLRNWSLTLDLYIMLRTVWVVLRGDNAH
jgi:putative colanic acid biosynthesis UDP-glucose lipid carrier transferase